MNGNLRCLELLACEMQQGVEPQHPFSTLVHLKRGQAQHAVVGVQNNYRLPFPKAQLNAVCVQVTIC